MLSVRNISSGYGKRQVLFDVSLEVNPGEIVLISGANGSGKSTLLKCIYNLLPLWTGDIYFNGKRLDQKRPPDMIHEGIVYIPQKNFCFDNLTIKENLQIAGNILPRSELKCRIEKIFKKIGLENLKNRKPFNLSGGEKKLLALSAALINNPKIILFDEPLAGLDFNNKEKILKIITDYNVENKCSFLIIDHLNNINDKFGREIKIDLTYE